MWKPSATVGTSTTDTSRPEPASVVFVQEPPDDELTFRVQRPVESDVKRREIEKSRAALEARGNGLSWRDVAAETGVHKARGISGIAGTATSGRLKLRERLTCGATCIVDEPVRTRMSTNEGPAETTVSDRGMVTIPAAFRRRLDIEPGDKLRWTTDEEGNLSVEIVHQREGVFDDFEPVDVGETNAVEVEGEFGAE